MSEPGSTNPVRLAIVGIHGHGHSHVVRAQHLQGTGEAVLVAVADLRPAQPGTFDASVREFTSLADLLAEVSVDVVVLCTPIHTHFELTALALESGADVLLEKPPVRSLQEFSELAELIRSTGRLCQVGFQSLGSHAIAAIRERIAAGEIGEVVGVSASGCWVRTRDYWRRAAWAGKRVLNGIEVVDGVVTNPLAHAVATALALAGATRASQVASVDLDQYRANDIDADDTSVVRIRTTSGLPVTLALTLCAAERSEPSVTVQGTAGRIVFYYTLDLVQVFLDDRDPTTTAHDRARLLDDLVAHRRGAGGSLVCDFADTEGFTVVLDAVRRAPDPKRMPEASVVWVGEGGDAHAVVRDIEQWVGRAGNEHRTFAELGAPWTTNR
ncbi:MULTISPECIES: Gfo/Idh/MocA family protein [unclassified Cryobacterium]|uniref:Gfo/Idh/MocA family protein n=1 Tax=unclassified Cryobacterium TaxID=2649013 RepID=UPI000CE4A814|nr:MULTISPECIES: Gfo/Idh/MocA family oxidoreductase [unclassified Cryobacterium]